jgi:hypothetical protein
VYSGWRLLTQGGKRNVTGFEWKDGVAEVHFKDAPQVNRSESSTLEN